MKTLLLFALVTLLAIPVLAIEKEEKAETVMYGGVTYSGGTAEAENGYIWNIGFGQKMFGPIWMMGSGEMGEYESVAMEMAIFIDLAENLQFGLTTGPKVDHYDPQEGVSIWQMVGASGGMLKYNVTNKLAFLVFAKYKYKFEEEISYKDGWVAGFNFMAGVSF